MNFLPFMRCLLWGNRACLAANRYTIRYSRTVARRYQEGSMVVFGHPCSANTTMLKTKSMQYGRPKNINALCVHNFGLYNLAATLNDRLYMNNAVLVVKWLWRALSPFAISSNLHINLTILMMVMLHFQHSNPMFIRKDEKDFFRGESKFT